MRKEEFLRQLEYLLQDIPEMDREEAINYYQDYLDEAGPENEEYVLREFGSPERIASIIRSDHNGNLEDGGSFTERGYEDERFREPNYQLAKQMDLPEERTKDGRSGMYQNADEYTKGSSSQNGTSSQKQHDNPQGNGEWKKYDSSEPPYTEQKPRTSGCLKAVLFAILLVAAAPVIFGAGGAAVGILTAVVVTAAVLIFLAALLTIIFLFVGVVLFGAGVAALWSDPVEAVLAIGSGLLILGLGLLALVFSVWFYGKLIPWIFRGIGKAIDAASDWVRRRGK